MKTQFASLSVQDHRAMLLELREVFKASVTQAKADKAMAKAERMAARELKLVEKERKAQAAIEKAQARLAKLLEKQAAPVGIKALKANRKPGKVVTYGAEDNAIAKAIMAKSGLAMA